MPIFLDDVESAHNIASILAIDKGVDKARANIDRMAFCLLSSVVGASSVEDIDEEAFLQGGL